MYMGGILPVLERAQLVDRLEWVRSQDLHGTAPMGMFRLCLLWDQADQFMEA